MSDDFDWNDRDLVAVPEQQALAVYTNPHNQVVLRFYDSDDQQDRWVVIAPEHIDRLCEALRRASAEAIECAGAQDNV